MIIDEQYWEKMDVLLEPFKKQNKHHDLLDPNGCYYEPYDVVGWVVTGYFNLCGCGYPDESLRIIANALNAINDTGVFEPQNQWDRLLWMTLCSSGFICKETKGLSEIGSSLLPIINLEIEYIEAMEYEQQS